MTSRERVLAAVNHQPVDRVPVDLGGIRASGINAVVYHKIKRRLGIDTPTKIHDSMQILAELEPEFIERFQIDVLPLEIASAEWADAKAATGVERRLFEGTTVHFPPRTDIRLQPRNRRDQQRQLRLPRNDHAVFCPQDRRVHRIDGLRSND